MLFISFVRIHAGGMGTARLLLFSCGLGVIRLK